MFAEPALHPLQNVLSSRCIIRRSLLVMASYFTTDENGLVLRRYWTKACQSCAIKHGCENRAR